MITCRLLAAMLVGLGLAVLHGCGTGSPRFTAGARGWNSDGDWRAELDGIASYYADEFHGRTTANGETYDMHGLTAAHRTLPFNSILRVTSLVNGKSVVVRVNDRGPFKGGRVIDLSLGAAELLGLIASGTAAVKIEILEIGPTSPQTK